MPSDSTHMPPTGMNRPSAMRSFIRAKMSGWSCSSQAYCWAELIAYLNSGSSSISARALATVRATLRRVSRTGHSQAESMCAWPMALMSMAEALAGLASTSDSAARACSTESGSCSSKRFSDRCRALASCQYRGESLSISAMTVSTTSRSVQ